MIVKPNHSTVLLYIKQIYWMAFHETINRTIHTLDTISEHRVSYRSVTPTLSGVTDPYAYLTKLTLSKPNVQSSYCACGPVTYSL